jgi:hypothetical protein
MIRAIELTNTQFTLREQDITALLKPLKEFTSPTYQLNGIETINGKLLLLEPKQQVFIDAISSLNIPFTDIDKSIIKVLEI